MRLRQWQNIFLNTLNVNPIVQHPILNENGIIKHVNINIKVIVSAKKI